MACSSVDIAQRGQAGAMRGEPAWTDAIAGKVVHVVRHVTDEVFSFLGPATNALARSGFEQAVVAIDEARYRHRLVNLHRSTELVLTPSMRNPIKQWRAVLEACRLAITSGPLHAVHLHGLLPGLVGASAVRAAGVQVPIFYSPHGSPSLAALRAIGAPARLLFRPLLRHSPSTAIVNIPRETMAFESWNSVALVESPVSDAFHTVPRNEARHPLIVSGGRVHNARSVELFAQLAVLLSGEDLCIGFNWIGAVDAVSRLRLTAANVAVVDVASDAECATRVAAAWIGVAPGGSRGFPLFLVEAMAAGLPCVAMDDPQYREVIRDGVTGFLCRSERDMIGRIAALIDSPAQRARIGAAAREEARRRFAESKFSAKLLAAYAVPAVENVAVQRPSVST
jgi:glycosyltransferase involved in cell wall biosynthesis